MASALVGSIVQPFCGEEAIDFPRVDSGVSFDGAFELGGARSHGNNLHHEDDIVEVIVAMGGQLILEGDDEWISDGWEVDVAGGEVLSAWIQVGVHVDFLRALISSIHDEAEAEFCFGREDAEAG